MKLSFIIPTYNAKAFLMECLASIQKQTMQDFECIIVDDESTDGTYASCLEMAKTDNRIKPIQLPHCCAANCRNAGLKAAQGEYVWFIDSDDKIVPEAAEKTINFIETNNLEMAMLDGTVLPGDASTFSFLHSLGYLRRKANYGFGTGKEILLKMIANVNFNCYVFLQVAKRNAIKHNFPVIALDEDFVYTVKNLLELDRVGHLMENLYLKRCRSKSTLTSSMTLEKTASLATAIELLSDWIERMLLDGRLSKEDVSQMERLLLWNAREIKTRYKRLNEDEIYKVEQMPFKERLHLKMLAGI